MANPIRHQLYFQRMDTEHISNPAWLQWLDHTADELMAVEAPDLPTLFSRAAWGMFSLLTDLDQVRPLEAVTVSVEADDTPALMVRWLSELNFLHTCRLMVFSEFTVLEASAQRVVAEVRGEPIARARHPIHTEIKAVTFHGLRVKKQDGAWKAHVLFDM